MCNHENREAAMTIIKDGVWCDPCLEPIIRALNDGGLPTVASCCGHGNNDGSIALADGRWLVISAEPPTVYSMRDAEVRRQAAPQAESEHPLDKLRDGTSSTASAIGYAKSRQANCNYSHELDYCTKCGWSRPAPVRTSSTVDEDEMVGVIRNEMNRCRELYPLEDLDAAPIARAVVAALGGESRGV